MRPTAAWCPRSPRARIWRILPEQVRRVMAQSGPGVRRSGRGGGERRAGADRRADRRQPVRQGHRHRARVALRGGQPSGGARADRAAAGAGAGRGRRFRICCCWCRAGIASASRWRGRASRAAGQHAGRRGRRGVRQGGEAAGAGLAGRAGAGDGWRRAGTRGAIAFPRPLLGGPGAISASPG